MIIINKKYNQEMGKEKMRKYQATMRDKEFIFMTLLMLKMNTLLQISKSLQMRSPQLLTNLSLNWWWIYMSYLVKKLKDSQLLQVYAWRVLGTLLSDACGDSIIHGLPPKQKYAVLRA